MQFNKITMFSPMRSSLKEQGYRKALITGTSSGLGEALAEAFIAEGLDVVGLSRRFPENASPSYHHLTLDLLDEARLESALRTLERDPPDIWVNNAGHGLVGDAWSAPPEEIENLQRLLYEIPVRLTRVFEHACRREQIRPACLVQVSSLAVELPIPAMPYYNAAKAALSAFTQSLLLDGELPFQLIDFRPGDFNTGFMQSDAVRNSRAAGRPIFKNLLDRHQKAPAPEKAAARLIRAIDRGRSGTVRSGTLFQSVLAPLGPRLLPRGLLHALIRANYR